MSLLLTLCFVEMPVMVASAQPTSQPATQPATRPSTQPTMVGLSIDAKSLSEAARQLGRQTGLPLTANGRASGPIHYAAAPAPLATALTDFLTQTGLSLECTGANAAMLTPNPPLCVASVGQVGTLVVNRVTMNAQKYLLNPGQPTNYSYTLQATFVADPGQRVIGVSQNLRPEQIDADPPIPRVNEGYGGNDFFAMQNALAQGSTASSFQISFNAQQPIKKINSLVAHLRGWRVVEEAAADASFDDIADGKTVEGSGVTAIITGDDRPQFGGQGLRVRLSGPAIDLYRDGSWMQALRRSVVAVDGDGVALPTDAFATQFDPKTKAADLTVRPTNGRAAQVFEQLAFVHVRIPTKVKVVDLAVRLKDLNLQSP